MIRESTIKQAAFVFDSVNWNNKKLSVIGASPLNALISVLSSYKETGANAEIIEQSIKPGTSMGTHDNIESYTAKQIATIMGNILNTAKNVVNPHCRAIIDLIDEERKTTALQQTNLLGNIIQVEVPKLLADDMFLELTTPYKNVPATSVKGTGELFSSINTIFTSEEIVILVNTGSSSVDEKISEYCNIANEVTYLAYGKDEISVSEETLKKCVLMFLLLSGIQNEKLDQASALMSNSNFKLLIAQIRAACGGKICRDSEILNESISKGEIVARPVFCDFNEDNTLYVYGVNYRNWIQNKGGSPEAALGFLALTKGVFSLAADTELRENPERYAEEYNNRIAHAKALVTLHDINQVRRTTANYMAGAISKMEDISRPDLQAKLVAALEHEYHGTKDLTNYVVKVVSRTLTTGSDVKDILLEMDSIISEQEKPDMSRAVFLASVRLVAKWLKSQMLIQAT